MTLETRRIEPSNRNALCEEPPLGTLAVWEVAGKSYARTDRSLYRLNLTRRPWRFEFMCALDETQTGAIH